MFGIALLMLAIVLCGGWLRWRGCLFDTAWFLRLCILCIPLGFIAVLAGWTVTEVGRQPWLIYEQLRTADGVSPSLAGEDVLASLFIYIVVYIMVFGAGGYYMYHLIKAGPALLEIPADILQGPVKQPLSGEN
jgi:cytochrome d ubiquinol oxidase subunit I